MAEDEVPQTPASRRTHLRNRERRHGNKRQQHVCRFCRRAFVRFYHLTVHLKSHTGEKPFHCDDCGKGFSYPNHLSRHQCGHKQGDKGGHKRGLVHKNNKAPQTPAPIRNNYNCDQCGVKFKTELGLKVHKSTHQEKKSGVNTKCKYCGQECYTIHKLKRHYESHTTEKPFRCDDCGKRFGTKGHLGEHRLTHSAVKPFTCQDCGKGFIRKRALRAHVKIHVEERPHRRHNDLIQEKAFFCKDCGTVVKVCCTTLSNVFSVTNLSDVKCFMKNHSISPL